jgi:hypothetical protein
MKAELLLNQRYQLADDAFMELVIWRVPEPVRGCKHSYKYRVRPRGTRCVHAALRQ